MGDLTKNPEYMNKINNPSNPDSQPEIKTVSIPTVKVDSIQVAQSAVKWIQDPTSGNWKANVSINGTDQPLTGGFIAVSDIKKAVINNVIVGVNVVNTYYIDVSGSMYTGWLNTADSKTYYFETKKNEDEGKMAIGWKSIQNSWYYFNSDGAMLRTAITPDGYFVGADGKWIS